VSPTMCRETHSRSHLKSETSSETVGNAFLNITKKEKCVFKYN